MTPADLSIKRWLATAAASVLSLAAMVVTAALSSCEGPPPGVEGVVRKPLRLAGVPVMRVRLGGRAVRSAILSTTGACRVLVDDRLIAESDGALSGTEVTRSGRWWQFGTLTATGRCVRLSPVGEAQVSLGRARYRGALELVPGGEDGIIVVNHVDIESYLAGVLSAELYPNWHDEAYRAQAVAARTFALYHRLTAPPGSDYDLGSGQSAQVYRGVAAETDKSWGAVRATHGEVLTVDAGGTEGVFMAQYSACCGGRVNGARVIRSAPDLAPLRGGQADAHCGACPRYRWADVAVPKSDLYRAVVAAYPQAGKLGGVATVEVTQTTDYGRAVWVRLVGRRKAPGGGSETLVLRAEDLRLALIRSASSASKLYSMNCKMRDAGGSIVFHDGRGWGHGVGLCQWGAQGKAEAGWTARQILEFYYPGAKLIRVYEP
jgi:stage II sporulation protein D